MQLDQNATKVAAFTDRMTPLFAWFTPSNRAILLDESQTDPTGFVASVMTYIDGWAEGTWLDEADIERITKWIARNASAEVVQALRANAQGRLSGAELAGANYMRAYSVVAEALGETMGATS